MSIDSRLYLTIVALAMGMALTACTGGNGQIVSVNGTNVSKAELDKRLEASPVAKQTLSQIVQGDLIDQYAKANNISVSDADVTKKEDEIRSKYPPGQFEQILKNQGLSEDDVKKILRQQIVIEQAVGKNVTITDADAKAYFDKNHPAYDKPEQVRARHILVPDLKTANDVEAKLKAGGDFATLAKQYSTDPASKDKGGELGLFAKGAMVPAFQNAAFALPVGKTSDPVKSPFGYHIIQVEEHKPATKATFESVKPQVMDSLKQQQQAQQVPAFLQGLRQKANIVVYDQRFSDVFPPPIPTPAPAPSTK
ncbi:MAG TPA: peptidylprolyl isomerase [Candidatus Binatia bacterium]|nr:peptidylprolyl isomerase [Candidatus Binatia bacterium]